MPDAGGPYVTSALLCERVLNESDGVISAIRIVDRMHVPLNPQTQEPPGLIGPLTAVITFKAGEARGRHTLRLSVNKPSGLAAENQISIPLVFDGEDRGAGALIPIAFGPEEGVWWISVYLDDEFVTKIPLRIVFLPATQQQ